MTGPDLELEERLRRLAPGFRGGIEPPATLHLRVTSATTARRSPVRRPSMLRELSLAAALIAFVALLAFGFSRLHSVPPGPIKPTPRPTPKAIRWTPAPMVLPSDSAQLVSPGEAAGWIEGKKFTFAPLLLPANIGAEYQANLLTTQNGFMIQYLSSAHHATIELATSHPSLPPSGAHGSRTTQAFRGVTATYQVDDATSGAPRWLLWTENGTPYSLIADGLTDLEFWQVARSLTPIAPPSPLRPCVSTDLHALVGPGNGASGRSFNSVFFSNHSTSPCQLDGTPRVLLKDAAGRTLPLPQIAMPAAWAPAPTGPVRLNANSIDPDTSQSVGIGYGWLDFSMWDCPANPPLSRVLIVLAANRGTIDLPAQGIGYSWGGECEGTVVRRMEVSPFVATQPQPTYVDRSPLSVTINLPGHVRAGQPLHYSVTLTNASGAPFHFDDCPSYTEDASRPGSKNLGNYQLNCASVGWLAPDQGVTFDMVLDIPANTPLGPGGLRWEMRSSYGNGDGTATLTVTAA